MLDVVDQRQLRETLIVKNYGCLFPAPLPGSLLTKILYQPLSPSTSHIVDVDDFRLPHKKTRPELGRVFFHYS